MSLKIRDFTLLRILGNGGFGTVYEASRNGEALAIKKVQFGNLSEE